MTYADVMYKFGIKMVHVARRLGTTENLLRYHLAKNPLDLELRNKIIAILKEDNKKLVAALRQKIK